MKMHKYIIAIVWLIIVVAILELLDLGFFLMNRPSSMAFYAGLVITAGTFLVAIRLTVFLVEEVLETSKKFFKKPYKNKKK